MYYASEVRKAEGMLNMLYRYRIILMDDLVLLFRHSSYFSSEELVSQFEVGKIRGITKNLSVNSNQFAIHLKRGKDEILSSPDRFNVIEALKFSYFNDTGKNVPVYKSYNIPDGSKADFDMELNEDDIIEEEEIFNERDEEEFTATGAGESIKIVTKKEVTLDQFDFVKNKPADTLDELAGDL